MSTLPFTLTRPLVFLDIESTGVDPQRDRIVELSLVIFRPERDEPEIRTRRLNPGVPIPAEATEVHGITDDDVVTEPEFRRIAEGLLFLLEDCDLAGTNIRRYDLPMLIAEFERCGMRFDHQGRRILDTQVVFYAEEPRDLSAAVRFYLDRGHDGAHGAEADALASAEVLTAQVQRYDLPTDLDELHARMDETIRFETEVDRWWDTSDEDPRQWVFKRGKHKGEKLGSASVRGYLEWMCGKADDMPVDVKEVAQNMLLGRYG